MVSNVTLNSQYSSAVNSQCRLNDAQSDFNELLSAKSTTNYDKMTEWAKGLWSKTVVHEIDLSEVTGLHRKDFPQALLFKNNLTTEELKKCSPTCSEPKSNFDPGVFRTGRAACMQNGVAILVSPIAINKMNNDDDFFDSIMKSLEEKLYPSIRESMEGLPRIRTKGDFIYTSTDCSIIVEIDDEGCVSGEVISCGECRKINEDENEDGINIDGKDILLYKSFDDNEIYRHDRHCGFGEQPILTQPEQDYFYNFLGCFNFNASGTMIEYRKRQNANRM